VDLRSALAMKTSIHPISCDLAPNDAARLFALYTADEKALTASLAAAVLLDGDQRSRIAARAGSWVKNVRSASLRTGMIDAFLQEYGLSTTEGVILMRLSEALIRTPDFATSQELMRDKLAAGHWNVHAGGSPALLINAATAGLRLSAAWIAATGGRPAAKLAATLGDKVLHAAVVRGMGVMANHFVLGSTIEDAVHRAQTAERRGALYSFDMLGEGACTQADAQRYFDAYVSAVGHLAEVVGNNATVATAHGLSVKLSALHPRYEYAKRETCVPVLIDRVRALALIAKQAGVGLTLDAEEADRLELSLQIFTALLRDPALANWDGLGIVVQAYQRRAAATIDIVHQAAVATNRQIAIRLVKGAYWDAEIKRAQELGLESYPVFTRKEHTDVSYLACAAKLLRGGNHIFPQFATHNAHTAAAIVEMAQANTRFEFQRLHGMGEALHSEICGETGIQSRVYAPVGNQKELLPYLVRRLLENGANSSFVNQLMNPEIDVDEVVRDPILSAQRHGFSPNPAIAIPRDLFNGDRQSALGMDLTQSEVAKKAAALVQSDSQHLTRTVIHDQATGMDVENAVRAAGQSRWHTDFTPERRANCLVNAANLLEDRMADLIALCVAEAGKTLPDAVSEIREAIDFCRYYANQAVSPRMFSRAPLGVVACISPWNFPLAIFIGQVAAALVAGNRVVAKPAVQTPRIADVAVKILHEAGVPTDALHVVIGGGAIGEALVGNAGIDAVCFTGSTATARRIAVSRAAIGKADTILIAETGGINAMIVDSTALLEQTVMDVVASAFQSAGQRCSACRIVCVQDDIADDFERMLSGAIALLQVGDPARLETDVGPIIDEEAAQRIETYVGDARAKHRVIAQAPEGLDCQNGHFVRPIAFAVNAVADVKQEVFGPVLHMVRFAAGDVNKVVGEINALGFGLTLGLHTRIDARVKAVAAAAKIGNLYVNRNQIGAVVGVQPFGGEGLSGTGPKAGGPHYLLALSRSTAARDGDTALEFQILGDRIGALPKNVELPGPTGEDNSVRLVPRGVLLCCGGDQPDDLRRQIITVCAAGSTVMVLKSPKTSAVQAELIAADYMPKGFKIVEVDDVKTAFGSEIDGVVAEGSARADLAVSLAHRLGAIIPLLSLNDDPERYFHERTLTIDTTAAGGNASLLALRADAGDVRTP
jgi:RHH-type transcriptional regulator, proline utilization regulon repressor / proline dehydrogenase / delta 1-pyrroline-5-carboxylate dehydrogenase